MPASSGDLFKVGDSDWYRVQLDRAYNYGITVRAYCPNTAVRLLDRDAKQLGQANGYFDFPAFITWQTSYTGLYYVEVKATGIGGECDPYNGAFHLTAVRECGPDARTRCTLGVGSHVDSLISAYNDKDWFKVDVPAKATYTFRVTDQVNGFFAYNPVLSLRRADSSVITESTHDDAYQCAPGADGGACLRVPLKAGRYYIAVRFPDQEGGVAYRLSLSSGS